MQVIDPHSIGRVDKHRSPVAMLSHSRCEALERAVARRQVRPGDATNARSGTWWRQKKVMDSASPKAVQRFYGSGFCVPKGGATFPKGWFCRVCSGSYILAFIFWRQCTGSCIIQIYGLLYSASYMIAPLDWLLYIGS